MKRSISIAIVVCCVIGALITGIIIHERSNEYTPARCLEMVNNMVERLEIEPMKIRTSHYMAEAMMSVRRQNLQAQEAVDRAIAKKEGKEMPLHKIYQYKPTDEDLKDESYKTNPDYIILMSEVDAFKCMAKTLLEDGSYSRRDVLDLEEVYQHTKHQRALRKFRDELGNTCDGGK